MSLPTLLFYFFSTIAAFSAIGILLIKNVFKAALLLLLCLLALAALYVLAFADFVATTQILIYAGGILVVIIFGIMLTSKLSGRPQGIDHAHIFGGTLVALPLCILLIISITKAPTPPMPAYMPTAGNLQVIGMNFMTDFALPFELAGILLLVALIGAAVTTSFLKSKKI
jgi:NADH:ubiquinone oxidoreductase subunit 6 (subunit J)